MLALKNSFSGHKVLLFFRAILEFVYLLKTAQQWKKESGCATPKENISRISAVDEEHFLVFSLFWTQVNKMGEIVILFSQCNVQEFARISLVLEAECFQCEQ